MVGVTLVDEIEEFVDERHKGWCVHCATGIHQVESNRDHVPSKSLLRKPYPENLPTVDVCKPCNQKFSADEEYFAAFIGCVLSGSTDPDRQRDLRVRRILTRSPKLRQHPNPPSNQATQQPSNRFRYPLPVLRLSNFISDLQHLERAAQGSHAPLILEAFARNTPFGIGAVYLRDAGGLRLAAKSDLCFAPELLEIDLPAGKFHPQLLLPYVIAVLAAGMLVALVWALRRRPASSKLSA